VITNGDANSVTLIAIRKAHSVLEIMMIAINMWMSAKTALAMDYLNEDATLRSRC
jgi:hypothetical protein